ALLLLGLTAYSCYIPFGPDAGDNARFKFLLIPLVLWGALRFGTREVSLQMVVIALFAAAATARGDMGMLEAQGFVGVFSISGLLLSTARAERDRKTRAVRAHELQYRLLAEAAADGILALDPNSVILYCNEAIERILGYRRDVLVGAQLQDVMID